MSPLRIGIVGGGTVGGGVWELLHQHPAVHISKIVVRSLTKPRDYAAPASLFTTNITTDILENPDIDCVVEVMGGTGLAKDVVLQALGAGKSVVTANKALLAEHLDQVAAAQAAAEKPLMYEAAVCGGIPIISTLQTAYAADQIQSIQGIANGTTNFMLTKMAQEGAAYDDVLKEAQDLGYAEADPTADVEGHDARAKICLLAKLAFGTTLSDVTQVPCQGIAQIQAADFQYCQQALQSTIKLVGTAKTVPNSNDISVYVAPVVLPLTHTLANINGSGNAITVTSQNMGPCLYTGPGAGRYPTANSVAADILRIATGQVKGDAYTAPFPFPPKSDQVTNVTDYTSAFYVRIASGGSSSGTSALPETSVILGWAKEAGVPEPSLLTGVTDLDKNGTTTSVIALTTAVCTKSQVERFLAKFPADCAVLAMPKM